MPLGKGVSHIPTAEKEQVIQELADLMEKPFIQRRGTAEGQGQAMADKRVALSEAAQFASDRATETDPVFGGDLKKINGGGDAGFQGGNKFLPKA